MQYLHCIVIIHSSRNIKIFLKSFFPPQYIMKFMFSKYLFTLKYDLTYIK
jgi:hypothetical protein